MTVDSLYLENLDEFINDENKIVTYKWLSLTLQVHCNTAKQMLYKFVQDERNEKDNVKITVTYFVSGLAKPDVGADPAFQAFKCAVVPEEKLDTYKSTLAVVTSCHIYSVQKTHLKDSNSLYMTDFAKVKENILESSKYSSIQHKGATLRSQAELDKLASVPAPSVPQDKKPTPSTNGHAPTSVSKPAGKKQPQSGIASMFAKTDKKKEEKTAKATETKKEEKTAKATETKKDEKSTKTESKEDKTSTKGGKKQQGGLMTFFSKQTDKKPAPKESPPSTETSTKTSPSKGKKASPIFSKSKKNARTMDSDDEEEDVGQTKRRRIKPDLFDSDSEEDMEAEDDEPIPPTPPPREATPEPSPGLAPDSPVLIEDKEEPIPKKTSPGKESTKGSNSGERKRKRTKKLVPKTYMDDDGYMVTEKVWEDDSTDASEVEDPVPAKSTKVEATKTKPSPTKGKKKGSPKKSPPGKKGGQGPGSGKQQKSLMSFFKKA